MFLLASCSSVQISKRRYSRGFSLDFRKSGAEANQRPAPAKKTKKASFARAAREFSALMRSDSLPVGSAPEITAVPAILQPDTVKTPVSGLSRAAAVQTPVKVRHQRHETAAEPAPPAADTAFTATHVIVFSVVILMVIGYLLAGNWIAGLMLILLIVIGLLTDWDFISCCL